VVVWERVGWFGGLTGFLKVGLGENQSRCTLPHVRKNEDEIQGSFTSFRMTTSNPCPRGGTWDMRFCGFLWRGDADGVGAAGAEGAAAYGLEGFAHADFDCGEVVVAAA